VASEKWLHTIREDFPVLKKRRNGKPPVYFDNACTALVPEPVIKAINEYYHKFPACGGGEGKTIKEAEALTEDSFSGALGSRGKDFLKKSRGILELLNRGLARYKSGAAL
jgi:cysteine desulfurase/selenocysteine lyase